MNVTIRSALASRIVLALSAVVFAQPARPAAQELRMTDAIDPTLRRVLKALP